MPHSPSVALLQRHYGQVIGLREFLITVVPRTSLSDGNLARNTELHDYIESIIVCLPASQAGIANTPLWGVTSMSDLSKLIIDDLLQGHKDGSRNLLSLGYTRGNDRNEISHLPIAGLLVSECPNSLAATFANRHWQSLLETYGERVIKYLLQYASLYVKIEHDTLYQLTGTSLVDVLQDPATNKRKRNVDISDNFPSKQQKNYGKQKIRSSHEVQIVRSRSFFSRPSLNTDGDVVYAFKHIHVLNRFSKVPMPERLRIILKDVFPLQHNLHNVFSSHVDRRETVQKFKDYTMRDDLSTTYKQVKKISTILSRCSSSIREMQTKHRRCSYRELLFYHCPVSHAAVMEPEAGEPGNCGTLNFNTQGVKHATVPATKLTGIVTARSGQPHKEIFTDFATPISAVLSFVRGVFQSVIPTTLLNSENSRRMIQHFERFLALRRFETMTLADFMHGLSLKSVPWFSTDMPKLSLSQTRKREEVFAELIYWLVDSFVIPLLKSHFYITESHLFRNRVLYFRHDVWKRLTEPELARFRLTMFQELHPKTAFELLKSRRMGYATLRLLPKGKGARPITNLKRREMTKVARTPGKHGHLLPSINTIMQGVYSVLNHECKRNPAFTGFGIQSVNDIHKGLRAFRARLPVEGGHLPKLYFAKVDVKNCFDTIEQQKIIDIISDVLSEDEYVVQKFCRILPSSEHKVLRKFMLQARPADEYREFEEIAVEMAAQKPHSILVDNVSSHFKERQDLLELLKEHLTMHLVKIGKRTFRQDTGIPQGSILSSILCNCYYARLEAESLNFLSSPDTVCFRLIDDFLCITTDQSKAQAFLDVMHEGNAEYGCFVGLDKSLTNFEHIACNLRVPTLSPSLEFPYCGTTINTRNLNVRKDFSQSASLAIANTLTIDYTLSPGACLVDKVFQGIKLSCQAIFIDTNLNTMYTVLLNVYRSLVYSAMRYHVYVQHIHHEQMVLQAHAFVHIERLSDLLYTFLKSRDKPSCVAACTINRNQVAWLTYHAFHWVLIQRSARYDKTLRQLRMALVNCSLQSQAIRLLRKVARPANLDCFASVVF